LPRRLSCHGPSAPGRQAPPQQNTTGRGFRTAFDAGWGTGGDVRDLPALSSSPPAPCKAGFPFRTLPGDPWPPRFPAPTRRLASRRILFAPSSFFGYNPLWKLPRINLRRIRPSPRRVGRMGRGLGVGEPDCEMWIPLKKYHFDAFYPRFRPRKGGWFGCFQGFFSGIKCVGLTP